MEKLLKQKKMFRLAYQGSLDHQVDYVISDHKFTLVNYILLFGEGG